MPRPLLAAVVSAILTGACAAPQTSGIGRGAYIGTATFDGMVGGMAVAGGACALVDAIAHPDATCGWPLLIGLLAGGAAAAYGTVTTDRSAGALEVTAVVAVPVGLISVGVWAALRAWSRPMH